MTDLNDRNLTLIDEYGVPGGGTAKIYLDFDYPSLRDDDSLLWFEGKKLAVAETWDGPGWHFLAGDVDLYNAHIRRSHDELIAAARIWDEVIDSESFTMTPSKTDPMFFQAFGGDDHHVCVMFPDNDSSKHEAYSVRARQIANVAHEYVFAIVCDSPKVEAFGILDHGTGDRNLDYVFDGVAWDDILVEVLERYAK